jgi:predicted permease
LTEIISILLQTILPVLLIAGAGYLLQRRLHVDVRTASRLALYVFSPCLAFTSLARSEMAAANLWRMAGISTLMIFAMVAVGTLLAVLLRAGKAEQTALQLTLAFGNSGNFGLSVCFFAFGQAGMDLAIIYFMASLLLSNSLGVFLASRGGAGGTWRAALRNTLTMPALYAALLGVLVNYTGWTVPTPVMRATELAAQAAVPTMLLVLGMQLTRVRLGHDSKLIGVATPARLILAPAIAVPLAAVLSMSGLPWQVALVESAMPTAVTTIILSEEFGASTQIASGMVLVTTLASIVTLTLLLAIIT